MKYKVKEKRMQVVEYIIEADTLEEAGRLEGIILDETETDNYGYELVSCKETDE